MKIQHLVFAVIRLYSVYWVASTLLTLVTSLFVSISSVSFYSIVSLVLGALIFVFAPQITRFVLSRINEVE